MRAVLSVEDYSTEQLDELVAARLERQAVVGRAYLTAVIDEHVIRRPIGSAAVMAEQCGHLAVMAGRPRTELHVIPEGTNWRKASYSSNGGAECVEIGAASRVVLVRDTQDRTGPVLRFSSDTWRSFTSQIEKRA